MTDKEKIREEIEKLHGNPYYMMAVKDVLKILDMQEEPVSEELEKAAEDYGIRQGSELKPFAIKFLKAGAEYGKNQAMAEIQVQSMALAHGCPKKPVSEDLKNAADNALDKISKKYDIVNIKSCLEMFRLGAEWSKKHLWKPADGDDLPEIDREVIVLCKNGRVAFGHRPVEKFIARPIGYGRTEEYEVKTYDKGGWNIPDIVYWLDIELPKEIEP